MWKIMMAIGISMFSLGALAQVSEDGTFALSLSETGRALDSGVLWEDSECSEFPSGHEVYEFFVDYLNLGVESLIIVSHDHRAGFGQDKERVKSCGCVWAGIESVCVGDNHAELGRIVVVDPRVNGWVLGQRRAPFGGGVETSYYSIDGLPELLDYYRNEERRSTVH